MVLVNTIATKGLHVQIMKTDLTAHAQKGLLVSTGLSVQILMNAKIQLMIVQLISSVSIQLVVMYANPVS